MAIKQKKPEPVVFDTPRDLLIAMIIGRHFAHNKRRYYFSNKWKCFMYAHGSYPPIDGDESEFSADDVRQLCRVLVGKKLVEVAPQFISVDTLLLVSDIPNNWHNCKKRYFSHWEEGRVNTFADGATSETNASVENWRFWKFPNPTDIAKEAK